MTTFDTPKISKVDCSSPLLPYVKTLWRSHANTLGFFPDGAFETYAEKKLILVATDSSDNLLGYLLYRVTPSRNDASIVHLCIDKSARGKGIASKLVKELFISTKSLRGVGLKCRRDFDANKLWPKLGFVAVSENAGRSTTGSTLTRWWYDHNHPNLFSIAQDADLDKKRKVIIDANIFYDLKNENNEETMALTADWLDDCIAICISDELLNEINRASTSQEREACRAFSTQFPTLKCDPTIFDETFGALKKYLPANPSEQDRSDLIHLAKAIAGNADFFVTRDDAILDKCNEVYEEFGIPILRPSDLITEIDTLYRESEYQPARLAGTLYAISRVQSQSEGILVGLFQNDVEGEKQSNLKENLRKLLSTPHNTECYMALDQQNNPIGLIAFNIKSNGILKIELLRVLKKHSLASTIVRFLIGQIIKRASKEKRDLIQVTDKFMDSKTNEALAEDHFISLNDGWYKISLHEHAPCSNFIDRLANLRQEYANLKEYCENIQSTLINAKNLNDANALWKVEALFSPGLISDSEIPCYIVPIKPYWAQQLFDEKLAGQDLFGAKINLALNREAIYYRSIKNSFGISAPARIIWYVSQHNKFHGSGGLRAYSRLEDVILGYPKQLFRQFRRLGIYEWKDVIYTAKSEDNQLMAIRFSNTTMLEKSLEWDKLMSLLTNAGINTQLQCPCPIPESLFFSIISES
ncbi:MAG: GNAT family N-acetyltransferase [Methylophilus sp.]|nr:GNAT family N-acetyltransferase [Methylophilus sp.]